jgi:hypothetical protein
MDDMAHDLFFGPTKRDWSCGSLLMPAKQQRAVFAKIDDVRYDLRRVGNKMAIATLCLAAGIGLLGIASAYRTTRLPSRGE